MKCAFTGVPVIIKSSIHDRVTYDLTLNEKTFQIMYEPSSVTDEYLTEKRHLIAGLFQTGKWIPDHGIILTRDYLEHILSQFDFPNRPDQKLNDLFTVISRFQIEDGEDLNRKIDFDSIQRSLFFRSTAEMIYYLRALGDLGYIDIAISQYGRDNYSIQKLQVTYSGLNYALKLNAEGRDSNLCFIAMAFSEETASIRTSIKKALKTTNYQPVLIDEQHIASDQTINDAIIAGLRRCKFCIADFTLHRNGVYFESGFALGQGKPVIYTCRDDEFSKAHFDIKPLQHIIYKTVDELEVKLVDKIRAWID